MDNKKPVQGGPVTALVRQLRRDSTAHEDILWQFIRNRQILNVKFRRQHPLYYAGRETLLRLYVADFYSIEAKLAIELDGSVHEGQELEDAMRDEVLQSMGITVLRFQNSELDDPSNVLEAIAAVLMERI
jgi:very-short-patch-repair endonuclease